MGRNRHRGPDPSCAGGARPGHDQPGRRCLRPWLRLPDPPRNPRRSDRGFGARPANDDPPLAHRRDRARRLRRLPRRDRERPSRCRGRVVLAAPARFPLRQPAGQPREDDVDPRSCLALRLGGEPSCPSPGRGRTARRRVLPLRVRRPLHERLLRLLADDGDPLCRRRQRGRRSPVPRALPIGPLWCVPRRFLRFAESAPSGASPVLRLSHARHPRPDRHRLPLHPRPIEPRERRADRRSYRVALPPRGHERGGDRFGDDRGDDRLSSSRINRGPFPRPTPRSASAGGIPGSSSR